MSAARTPTRQRARDAVMIGAALLIGVHAAMAIGDAWSRWSLIEQHRAYGEAMLTHGEPEQARAAFERAYALAPSAESWAALVESQAALVARAQRVPARQRAAPVYSPMCSHHCPTTPMVSPWGSSLPA